MRTLNKTFIALFALVSLVASSTVGAAEPATEGDAHGADTTQAAPHGDDAAHGSDHAEPKSDHGDDHGTHHADTKGHGDAKHGDAHGDAHGKDAHGDGHHGDHHDAGIDWLGLAQHLFNLSVLLGVLFFFGRKAIGDALRQRGLGIRNDLTEAARERDEAKQRQADIEARLTRFESELEGMRNEAEQSAKDEEKKLIKRAEEASTRIAETAERNIRDEVVRAQVALRKEAVELAVQLAEDTLKGTIKADDHRRLARQFLESLDD